MEIIADQQLLVQDHLLMEVHLAHQEIVDQQDLKHNKVGLHVQKAAGHLVQKDQVTLLLQAIAHLQIVVAVLAVVAEVLLEAAVLAVADHQDNFYPKLSG